MVVSAMLSGMHCLDVDERVYEVVLREYMIDRVIDID